MGKVDAITDDKFIGDFKSDVVGFCLDFASRGFVEQGDAFEFGGISALKKVDHVIEQRNSFTGGSYVHQFTSSNGGSGGPALELIVVPEATSVSLLLIGFSCVLLIRRR